MKRSYLLVLLFVFLLFACEKLIVDLKPFLSTDKPKESSDTTFKNSWQQLTPFTGKSRMGSVAFSLAGKGYFGLGHGEGIIFYQDFWEYDPQGQKWTRKADFPGGARSGAISFTIGNKAYVGTGMRNGNAEMLKDFYEYDPSIDQWTKKANYEGIAVDQAVGFSIGNKGYIGLGLSSDTGAGRDMSNHLWEYDPASDTWTRKKNWPFSEVSGGISFRLNNKAYVGIGWGYDHLLEYDPEKDEWTRTFDFQGVSRSGAVAFTINEKAFILAGATAGSFLADLWAFEPAKP